MVSLYVVTAGWHQFQEQQLQYQLRLANTAKKNTEQGQEYQAALHEEPPKEVGKATGTADDLSKASEEVAEISKLLGKPLNDVKALSLLKDILLEKIHKNLEETKISINNRAEATKTAEGVNKFVAALAASSGKSLGKDQNQNHETKEQTPSKGKI